MESVGADFDKPANARYFGLRFPQVLEIHQDRTFKDTVSSDELQELARLSMAVLSNESEEKRWFEKLCRSKAQMPMPSSSSDISNRTAFAEATEINTHDYLEKRNAGEEKGKRSPFHSSKRKITSEISPRPGI